MTPARPGSRFSARPPSELLLLTAWALPAAQLPHAEDPAFAVLRRAVPYELFSVSRLADLDGDGDLDAVSQSPQLGAPSLIVLENDGHARFLVQSSFPAAVTDVQVADLDGDRDPDVLGVEAGGLLLLENTGRLAFERVEMPLATLTRTGPMVLADVEQDGDLDAVFEGRSAQQGALFLARNRGDASFERLEALARVEAGALAAADFDGDGDVDLAHSGGTGQHLVLFLNDGGGAFAAGPTLLSAPSPLLGLAHLLAAGDVDGNGTVDLLFADQSLTGEAVHLLLNRGRGAFAEVHGRLPVSDYVSELVLADVDGDKRLDLLSGGLLLNDGSGFFKDATHLLRGEYGGGTAGDLDRDGDVDLLVGDRVALQDGQGFFHDPDAQEPYYGSGELEDLNGDGDLDSLGLANDGRGVFEEVEGAVPAGLGAGAPRFGDLDGDGDADAFVPGARPYLGGGPDQLIVNDGSGRFQLAAPSCNPSTLGDPGLTMDGALGDVDADGDLDVILARLSPGFACHQGPCYGPAPTKLWVNDGAGCFGDASSSLPLIPADGAFGIELGDIDADGDLDGLSSAQKVFLNAGNGSFTDASASFVPQLLATDVALGDADRDGDLDAFFSASRIALNDGSGRFPTISSGPYESIFPGFRLTLRLTDLNADDELDVVEGILLPTGRFFFPVAEFAQPYVNLGNATFQPLAFPATFASRFDLGDVDQDGDLDLFDGSQVYTNLTRSLAWRAHPRIGHPLVLDLTGSPRGPYLLLGATSSRSPLPTPFGMLQLDPASIRYRRAGFLDEEGRAALSWDLPRNAALVGRTLYWQAFVGSPVRLTNLEVVEISSF